MSLIDIFRNNNCNIINQYSTNLFKNKEYEFYNCRREIENLEFSHISDYYAVKFKDEDLINLFSYENNGFDNFQDFQQKLLSKIYFKYKNDLRWNIYLLIIIENIDILKFIPADQIENEESYARKYIFTQEELIKFLNKNYIFKKNISNVNIKLRINQLHQWIHILDKVELTGCISSKFSSESFENYLYKGIPFQDNTLLQNPKAENNAVSKQIPKCIRKVNLGSFRKHCFKREVQIEPSQVNLIYGINGCGKTSFLETIEFSITNGINRLKTFGEDFSNYPLTEVECELEDGSKIIYKSNQTPSYYKSLENAWYGVPIGLSKSTINENFGRFNYFDSDSAFKFAFDESNDNFDFGDQFSKLFFDESIVEMQKQWKRYKQEFETHLKRIIKQVNDDSNEKKILEDLFKSHNKNEDFNEVEINQLLERSEFRKDIFSLRKPDNILSYYQALYENLVVMEGDIEDIKKCDVILDDISIHNINEKRVKMVNDKEKIEKQYELELKNKTEIEKKIIETNNYISDYNSNKNKIGKIIEEYNDTLNIWSVVKNIVIQPEKIIDFNNFRREIELLNKKITLIELLINKYYVIIDLKEEDIIGWKEDEIIIKENELEIFEEKKKKIQNTIEILKKQLTKYGNLKSEIKKIANEYLSENKNEKDCPLCGAIYSSNEQLLEKIYTISNDEDNKLSVSIEIKEKEIYSLDKQISALSELLNEYKKRQKYYNILISAYNEVVYSNLYNCIQDESPISILEYVKIIMNSKEKLWNELEQLKSKQEALEKSGFSGDNLRLYYEFIGTSKIYNSYNVGCNIDDDFESYILTKRNIVLANYKKVEEEIFNKKEALGALNNSLTNITIRINSLYKSISGLNKELNILDIAIIGFEHLSKYFIITEKRDFNEWRIAYEELKKRCKIAVDKLIQQQEIEGIKKELNDKIAALDKNKKILDRCKQALSAFNQMPSLETAIIEFTTNNIERIEYLFKSLHRPKEFLQLKITEDGSLAALRGNDMLWVKAHQMSTGQRVSLALSVMLSLYLTAENAPKFIMLDEPVANMDDLHMLNLMDILREIALQGTQIFFTTANPDVAILFRRKFSFFGRNFKQYNLVRQNNDGTNIYVYTYNPNFEEGKKDLSLIN